MGKLAVAILCTLFANVVIADAKEVRRPPIGSGTVLKQSLRVCLTLQAAQTGKPAYKCDYIRAGLYVTIAGYKGVVTILKVNGADGKVHTVYLP